MHTDYFIRKFDFMYSRIRSSILLYLVLISFTSHAQFSFTDSNLPIVKIYTGGSTIIDAVKKTCDMQIIWDESGERNYITDLPNNYNGKIGIEIRGSTSQQYPKKSYGLETRDSTGLRLNVSLLGMPEENDWILYGAYPDKTLMRNEITFHLFSRMQAWSPRFVYCELLIDDEYMGVYSLLEKVKNDKHRVDIANLDSNDIAGDSLTGGYIIKIDKLTGSSLTTWTSPYQYKLQYLYHDPEDIEMTIEQLLFIKNYVTDFEDAVYGVGFTDPVFGYRGYIDVNSFIDFFLMQELGRTVDGYRSSSFMYKDKGEKLCAGPMWDFNLSYGNADYCAAYDTTGWQYNFAEICDYFTTEPPEWWPRLLEDSSYTRQMKCRWEELRTGILNTDSINAWIDSVALLLDESQTRNFMQWDILGEYVNWNYFVGDTYEEEIDYLKWWFKARLSWMDENLPGTCPDLVADTTYHDGFDPVETTINELQPIYTTVYPNPFSSTATFAYDSRDQSAKQLIISDLLGLEVARYVVPAGKQSVIIESAGLANGIYIYQFRDGLVKLGSGRIVISR